jgi:hypothetical protein
VIKKSTSLPLKKVFLSSDKTQLSAEKKVEQKKHVIVKKPEIKKTAVKIKLDKKDIESKATEKKK